MSEIEKLLEDFAFACRDELGERYDAARQAIIAAWNALAGPNPDALRELVEAARQAALLMEIVIPLDDEFMQKHAPLTASRLRDGAAMLRAKLEKLEGHP